VRGYAALGVHPQAVPRRGLSEVLSALPSYFGAGKVVALGAIGLHQGSEAEVEAFSEQLQLARRLKVPVLVTTPKRDKERVTKRALRMLGESGLPPQRVLVDRASPGTVPLVLECGYWASLAVHPDELSAETAVAIIRRRGAQKLMVSSSAGAGAGDILSLARLVNLLDKGHLSPQLIAKVAHENAAEFFRVPVPTWSP
jgi:predicted metal-dependent TIM-barrel fold hydrolase